MKSLYYGKQYIDDNDQKKVAKSLNAKLITNGLYLQKFEQELKNTFGSQYVACCNSGTSALDLVFKTIGFQKKKFVLMPSINFIASYSQAVKNGAKIILVDVDRNTGQITPEKLEETIIKNNLKEKIRAVVIQPHGGYPLNNLKFYKLKKKYNFLLIEDACHAFGAKYRFQNKFINIGSCKHSDFAIFSFHPVKTITTGEGGAIATNKKTFYEKITLLRSHGIRRKKNYWDYDIDELGNNYRLSDINCALGLSQIKKLKKFLSNREKIFKIYESFFFKKKLCKIIFYKDCKPSYHLIFLSIDFDKLKKNKDDFFHFMNINKIYPQYHYKPIYNFSFYKKKINKKLFDGSEHFYKNVISIPVYVNLSKKDQIKICKTINKFINLNKV